jgi:hypothetical protein
MAEDYSAAQDTDVLNQGDTKQDPKKVLADKAVKRAMIIVAQVATFKNPRLKRIQLYRDLYAGKVQRKFRQPFNVVLPVFSGMMDTLAADFNDDLALDFEDQEPADFLAVKKLNALWNMEVNSVAPNAMFAYKCRTDRFNALFSGRGFLMNYACSDRIQEHVRDIRIRGDLPTQGRQHHREPPLPAAEYRSLSIRPQAIWHIRQSTGQRAPQDR